MTAFIALDTWIALALKGAVVLSVAGVAAWLLRRSSSAVRHALWATALGALVALPLLTAVMPRMPVSVTPWDVVLARVLTRIDRAPDRVAARIPRLPERLAERVPRLWNGEQGTASAGGERRASAPPSEPGRAGGTLAAVVLWTWLAGAILLLARVAWGHLASRRTAKGALPLEGDDWLIRLESAALELGCRRRVRLLTAPALTVPVTCGILRPVILLPPSARAWDDERARVVLLHELAHVVRFDCAVHVLAQLAVALHWMNPLAWMAASRLRSERERACDDLVLTAGTSGPVYAEHLLDIARSAGRTPIAAAALAMARPSELEGRLLAVLDRTLRRGRAGRRAALVALLVSLAGASVMAAVTVRPLDEMEQATAAPTPTPTPAPSPAPAPAGTGTTTVPSRGVVGGVTGGVRGGVSSGQAATGTAAPRAAGPGALPAATRESVVQALVGALKDESPEVREQAMHALVQVRSPAAFEPILAALSDPDAEIRQQAAVALGQLEDRRAGPALARALSDSDAEVRQHAAFALGQLEDPSAAPALEKALKDADADVRQSAAFALSQIGGPSSVPGLVAALADADAEVRQQAAFALGQVGDARAVEPLTGLLKDKEPSVRQQAAFALGQVLGHDEDDEDRLKEKVKEREKDQLKEKRQQR